MLTYENVTDGYEITETIHGARDTTKVVTYSHDLSQKRVNDEAWRDTIEADRNWFEKCYRKHFTEDVDVPVSV